MADEFDEPISDPEKVCTRFILSGVRDGGIREQDMNVDSNVCIGLIILRALMAIRSEYL